MRRMIFGTTSLVLWGTLAFAGVDARASGADRKDFQVLKDVATTVERYSHFSIFDDVNAYVKDGVVTLTGKVTMPYKRNDIENRVAKVDGVQQVDDRLGVLPVSQFDNQLRSRIARAIYNNPNFWNYAIQQNPPIHIIVDHGHVTLKGVVMSDVDRALARSLAHQFGVMSVTTDLKTEAELRDAGEQSQ
jgi:hyperosmotically inducible protein